MTVEYHWLDGHNDRLPSLTADLSSPSRRPYRIPGVIQLRLRPKLRPDDPDRFRRGADPVELGLVASLARPGGNVTGYNFFVADSLPNG